MGIPFRAVCNENSFFEWWLGDTPRSMSVYPSIHPSIHLSSLRIWWKVWQGDRLKIKTSSKLPIDSFSQQTFIKSLLWARCCASTERWDTQMWKARSGTLSNFTCAFWARQSTLTPRERQVNLFLNRLQMMLLSHLCLIEGYPKITS